MTISTSKSLFDLKTITICTVFCLPLLGCGGGGSSDTNSTGSNTTPVNTPSGGTSSTTVNGGSASSPAAIQKDQQFVINDNPFYNYYKFTGKKGDKFFIDSFLSSALTESEKNGCDFNGSGNPAKQLISITDSSNKVVRWTCGEHTIATLPADGDYVLSMNFTSHAGTGYIASTTGDSAITTPTGTAGSPSNPIQVNTAGNNILSSNENFNYYKVKANAGDQLTLQVTLKQPISSDKIAGCSANTGNGAISDTAAAYLATLTYESTRSPVAHIYDSNFKALYNLCDASLKYTVPTTGTYILSFNYGQQSAGYFNLAILKP